MEYIQRLMYSLKNKYGESVDFYREIDADADILTGKTNKSRIKYHIKKAVLIDLKNSFKNTYIPKADIIAGNSGLIDTVDFQLFIDGVDMPSGYDPTVNDFVISDHQKFQITHIKTFDRKQLYYFVLKEFKGSKIYEIHDVKIHQKLTLIHIIKPIHGTLYTVSIIDTITFSETLLT